MPAPNSTARKSLLAGAVALSAATLGIVAFGSNASASDDNATAPAAQRTVSEKSGACGEARYDAEVDREGNGLETSFEIDDAKAGQRWQITLVQNGEQYFDKALVTDREGEIDVEQLRNDGAGVEEFVMTAKRLDGPGNCSVTLTR
jgi:uncharacterized low-complexity protein